MAETHGVKWHIIPGGQRLTTQISPNGLGFQEVWEIPFRIDSGPADGTESLIRVPTSQYEVETIKATVAALVKKLHDIASL
jgi:hypothetical protein